MNAIADIGQLGLYAMTGNGNRTVLALPTDVNHCVSE